jgi:hypothetical protein
MADIVTMPWEVLDRMEQAVAKVRERLLRSTAALNQASIPYAVVRDHAVASWVAWVDPSAVRNSPDIDLLVRREQIPEITAVLERAGFVRADQGLRVCFLDGPNGKVREAVNLLFVGEQAGLDGSFNLPSIATIPDLGRFRVLDLPSLVELSLILNRNQDRMHLHDLIGVGLIDRTWLARLPPLLAERLQAILDTPDG